jgi:hypothetical protein
MEYRMRYCNGGCKAWKPITEFGLRAHKGCNTCRANDKDSNDRARQMKKKKLRKTRQRAAAGPSLMDWTPSTAFAPQGGNPAVVTSNGQHHHDQPVFSSRPKMIKLAQEQTCAPDMETFLASSIQYELDQEFPGNGVEELFHVWKNMVRESMGHRGTGPQKVAARSKLAAPSRVDDVPRRTDPQKVAARSKLATPARVDDVPRGTGPQKVAARSKLAAPARVDEVPRRTGPQKVAARSKLAAPARVDHVPRNITSNPAAGKDTTAAMDTTATVDTTAAMKTTAAMDTTATVDTTAAMKTTAAMDTTATLDTTAAMNTSVSTLPSQIKRR